MKLLTLTVVDEGTRLLLAPGAYMDRPEFDAYIAMCKGNAASYHAPLKAWSVPVSKAPAAIRGFREIGFEFQPGNGQTKERINGVILAAKAEPVVRQKEALERASQFSHLYPYQREGVAWLAPLTKGAIFDQMGLGKSVQALLSAPAGAPILVICPNNAKGVWVREAIGPRPNEPREGWRSDLKVSTLSGRKGFRWPKVGELCVINYDILPDVRKKLPAGDEDRVRWQYLIDDPLPGTVIISDEIHACKNSAALRTKRFRDLRAMVLRKGGRVWGLTGTPVLNRPMELWNVLLSLDLADDAFRGLGGRENAWSSFMFMFGGWKAQWGWEFNPKRIRPDLISEALRRVSIRRRREDVLPDLPRKTHTFHDVNIFSEAAKIQAALEKLGITYKVSEASDLCERFAKLVEDKTGVDLKGVSVEEAARAVDLIKIQEVAFELISALRKALAVCKIPAMMELVEEFEEEEVPLVVFSSHRLPVETLAKRPGWAMIAGGVGPQERDQIVADFQAGKLKGLALTIGAGKEAITLTHAYTELFIDEDWSPMNNAQAQDRCCRIGQESDKVNIMHLVSDHVVDQRVTELLVEKTRLIEATVERASVGVGAVHVEAPPPVSEPLPEMKAPAATPAPVRAPAPRPEARPAPSVAPKPRRGPQSAAEEWAAEGLITLAGLDPDRAAEENGMGFSKTDGEFGHSLAQQLGRGLTEAQWAVAIRMLKRYHRQIGVCPEDQPTSAIAPARGVD